MNCHIHLTKEAIGHCTDCGKYVCEICLNKEGGRMYCDLCARLRAERRDSPLSQENPSAHPHHKTISINYQTSKVISLNTLSSHRIITAVLAFTLGGFGVHQFYLGRFGLGILYAIFSWSFIPSIIGFVQGINFLLMTDNDFAQRYGQRFLPTTAINHGMSVGITKPKTETDYEKLILQCARDNRGLLSVSQLVADTDLTIDKAEKHLARLAAKGYTRAEINPDNGAIIYIFAEFQKKALN